MDSPGLHGMKVDMNDSYSWVHLCVKVSCASKTVLIQKLKKAGLFYIRLEYEGSFFFVFLRYILFVQQDGMKSDFIG